MTKRILVTGGCGFIGRHLVSQLLANGYTVSVVDNLCEQVHGENPDISFLDGAEFRRCSVGDLRQYDDLAAEANIIIHLAAQTGTGQSMYNIAGYFESNVMQTSILIDFLSKNQVSLEKIIVASSRAVYGEGAYRCSSHGLVYPVQRSVADMALGDFEIKCPECRMPMHFHPTSEMSPLSPSSYYGLTKQIQEQSILMFANMFDIPGYALRFQNVIGEFQSLGNPYTGILAVFSNLARTGNTINVFEDGLESRDFVYVGDVVEAVIASITTSEKFIGPVNIGTGVATTVLDVADQINKYFGSKSDIKITGQYRKGDIRHNAADLRRAVDVLNFNPAVDFSVALDKFLNWASSQDPCDGALYENSLDELMKNNLLIGTES